MTDKKLYIKGLIEILEGEVNHLISGAITGEIKTKLSAGTIKGYKKGLVNGLKMWPKNKYKLLEKLNINGLNALNDSDYWISLEVASFKDLGEFYIPFVRALHTFFRILKNDESIARPIMVVINGANISLLKLYVCNKKIGTQFMEASNAFITIGSQSNATKKAMLQVLLLAINEYFILKNNHINLDLILKEIISYGVSNSTKVAAIRSAARGILECYKPEQYKKTIIKIESHSLDITKISKISPIIAPQLESLARSSFYNGSYGHKGYSLQSRLSHALRVILRFADENSYFKTNFNKYGLSSFVNHNYLFLKKLKENVDTRDFCALKNVVEHFSGAKIGNSIFFENILLFEDAANNIYRTLDISALAVFGKKIITDFKSIHDSELELLSQKSYGVVTLITRVKNLQVVLTKYGRPDVLDKYGIDCFWIDDGSFQLEVLMKIQQDVNNKRISRRTGESYISAIRWVCEITNQKFKNAYRITSNRHAVHAKRLSVAETYSEDDVRELAFYIEKLIFSGNSTVNDLVALYFARIQLKTCWNTSSLSRIDCDDIVEVDFPTKSKPISVLLQKPRKGYATDHFKFDPSISKSAIHDLQYVKNVLTSTIREKYKNDLFSTKIFILEDEGKIQTIKFESIVKKIADLLEKAGCSIRYNSAKLRKTGANYIYNQVSKDIKRYKDALKHSYPTFLKHYQRINEATTQNTLHEATSIMEKYFTGREICSDIHIATEYDCESQITPVGLCAATKNSLESKVYINAHKKFASVENSDRCSDFLACIWCKNYRVVADPDHVWLLLSFKRYVLSDMESTVAHFSQYSQQKQAINGLSGRVDSIINSIKAVNDNAVKVALDLMKNNGMHPSWNFVTSIEGCY